MGANITSKTNDDEQLTSTQRHYAYPSDTLPTYPPTPTPALFTFLNASGRPLFKVLFVVEAEVHTNKLLYLPT